jgi:uncharacterized repeat protein (TIGR01451 family)
MLRRSASLPLLAATLLGTLFTTNGATAAIRAPESPTLRRSFNVRGGYVLLGNTLAQDCRSGVPLPLAPSTLGVCGTETSDDAPDVFWTISGGLPAGNVADILVDPGKASARATLVLPGTATVRYARLYWAAAVNDEPSEAALSTATLAHGGETAPGILADRIWVADRGNYAWYQATADVTTIVQGWGVGDYDLSGIALRDIRNLDNSGSFAGFSLVVVYEDSDPAASTQNITLFDGFDVVAKDTTGSTQLSGFVAPTPIKAASLAVVAYEGEDANVGDTLSLNNQQLSDATNPAENFFNGSRSRDGVPVSNAGDLPRLSGDANTLSCLDLDVVDVKSALVPGSSSATIEPRSTADTFAVGAYVFGITVERPALDVIKKVDRSPARYVKGEKARYEIGVTNTGSGAANGISLVDKLPAGLTFAGNLTFNPGTGVVALTPEADNDGGLYDASTRTVTVVSSGASLATNKTWTVAFDVLVDGDVLGPIDNLATVVAEPLAPVPGEPTIEAVSHAAGGKGPTRLVVDACNETTPCAVGTCDTAASPHVCVGGQGGSGGSAGQAGQGGFAGEAAGQAGQGGFAGEAAGQAGQAGIAGQAGTAGKAGTGGTAGKAGAGGAAGKAGAGGAAGKAGAGGAAGKGGQAGTGSAGKAGQGGAPNAGGTAGKAGENVGGAAGNAPAEGIDDSFQGSGLSCAVDHGARPRQGTGLAATLSALAIGLAAWRRRRSR